MIYMTGANNNEPQDCSNKILEISQEVFDDISSIAADLRLRFSKFHGSNYTADFSKDNSNFFFLSVYYSYVLNKFLLNNNNNSYLLFNKEFEIINLEEKELLSVLMSDPNFSYIKRFKTLENEFFKEYILINGVCCKNINGRMYKKKGVTKESYLIDKMIESYGFYSPLLLNLENQVLKLIISLKSKQYKNSK